MPRLITNHLVPTQVTKRDLKLFQKLNAAGWLTTRQIRDYFFAGKSTNAVCKRLRKLAEGRYICKARLRSTESGFYRLAGQGKLALIEHTHCGEDNIAIPTQVPRKMGHFTAINDLRFQFEKIRQEADAQLLFFFSERELCRYYQTRQIVSDLVLTLLANYRIVPDAVAKLRIAQGSETRELHLLIEYDEGTEHAAFFGRTKVKQYAALFSQNYERLGDVRVLTFARSVKRIVSLMRQVVLHDSPHHLFYFASMERLNHGHCFMDEIFLDPDDYFARTRQGERVEILERERDGEVLPKHVLIRLPAASPRRLSHSSERENRITVDDSMSYAQPARAII